ncbi:MAG: 2-phospho-L-lactate transferase [Gammaproteobacteria bacterium]|jgi:LPPG:FO 2-phospho-L-lactate transferase
MSPAPRTYLAITGGVGGAKLCLGLARILSAGEVTFVVNTGDDFEHLGLHIAPDLDTLTYTLSGLSNPELGWGRKGESWNFIEAFGELGGETWFNLGDADLAIHLRRTELLRSGLGLGEVTARLAGALGIAHSVLPMSDDPVRTRVQTATGALAFQHYFVRDRCAPAVTGFDFSGAATARPYPAILERLADPSLAAIFICPSNPYVSIDPILAVPGLRDAFVTAAAPVIAISPIVDGAAIKGPTAKMMQELSVPASAEAVAAHYQGLVDGFIIDERDAGTQAAIAALGIETTVAQTVMLTLDGRIALARTALEFGHRLNPGEP